MAQTKELDKSKMVHKDTNSPTTTRSDESELPMAERPPRLRGNTYIDDEVVSVISRIAAEQVPGVHQIGESSLRNVLTRFRRRQGVEAEIGMHEAAADIELTIEFGYSMREVAQDVRERIIVAVESMTGRHVVEVNVFINDVYVPKSTAKRRRRELE